MMKRPILSIALMFCFLTTSTLWAERPIYRMRMEGPIGPTIAEFFDKTLDRAHDAEAICLVIEMDTPGGLDTAMRQIVKGILNASVPVVVYVSPSGSRAASAGAFIALAAHVAAMTPSTSIGAAHPVQMGGGMADTIMAAKVGNDAAAYMRSLAEKRNRDPILAETMVRESASFTEQEARDNHLIDLVAPTFSALCDSLQGKQVQTQVGVLTLQTDSAPVVEIRMGFRERMLAILSNPNLAYILMMLGIYGLIFELSNPGALLPGIIGTISLILAFYAFQTLPVNYAGLLLILVGVALLILEINIPSYGVLTIGGLTALALGSAMLFETPDRMFRISWYVIAPALIVSALFFAFAIGMGLRAQKRPAYNDALVGQVGVARTDIETDGTMFINGEYWQAHASEKIPEGETARVIATDDNKLVVRKA
jgi:membrane-bound serine protease (ClpP class)